MKNHALLLALCLLLSNSYLFAQTNCNSQVSIESTFTSMGSPLEGPYQPGEAVTFCINVDQFNQADCNWLHGIVPTFGEGWDESSFYTSGQPKQINSPLVPHTNGFWVWFPDNWITYKTTSVTKGLSPGDKVGAGWFFQNFAQPSINPFDPNFTRGDGTQCANSNDVWEVCFTIVAKELYDCPDVVDCSVGFTTFGDGETGAYGTPGCHGDSEVIFQAALDCCDGALVDPIPDIFICNEQTISIPLGSDGGPDVTYRWTAQLFNASGAADGAGNVIEQTLSLNTIGFPSFVIYNVIAQIDGCEGITETFKVTISNFTVDLGDDLHICNSDDIRIGQYPEGGVSPYTYNWEHGPTNYRPLVSPNATTTYFLTVYDAFGCSVTDDITVYVGQAGPIEGPQNLCGITSSSYSIPSFPGSSSYVWTVPTDATILSGQGTTGIQVDWGTSSGGELCVRPTGGCVSGLIDNCIEVSTGQEPEVDGIFGNDTPCILSTENYSVSSSESNVDFSWSVVGGEIIDGQGTDQVVIEWENSSEGSVIVDVVGPCGSVQKELEIEEFISSNISISGSSSVCSDEVAIYNAEVIGGVGFYFDWTVPSGASLLSGQGSPNIVVDWGSSIGGEIWVVMTGSCGIVGSNIAVSIFDGNLLEIHGPHNVCAGESVTFSLSPELPLGATVNWAYPDNFQVLSNTQNSEINGIWVNDTDGSISAVVGACGVPSYFDNHLVIASSGIVVDTSFTLCPGACIEFQGELFCSEGSFSINGSSGSGCGAVYNVDIIYLTTSNVFADAGNDTNVGCTVNTILDGSASSYPINSSVTWKDSNGNILGQDITLEVSEAGIYILEIYDAQTQCFDADTVSVSPAAPPVANAGDDLWLNCFNNFETQLMAVLNPNWTYTWTGPNGFSSNVPRPIVTISGVYILEVVDAATGCGSDTDEVLVQDGFITNIDFEQSICNENNGTASVGSEGIDNPEYTWSNGRTGNNIDELAAGQYSVTITNSSGNGCEEVLFVEVTADLSCKITIAGNVFDDGESGDCDPNDPLLTRVEDIPVTLSPTGLVTYTDEFGFYEFIVDTGSYEISVEVPEPYFVLCPGFQTLSISSFDTSTVSTDNHFFLDYLTNFNLFLTGYMGGANAGQSQSIQTQNCNYAPQTVNGRIELIHDPLVTFDPIANGADGYDETTFTAYWLFADMSYFDCEFLNFYVDIPGDVPDGTMVEHTVIAKPLLGDLQPGNNVFTVSRTVNNTSSSQPYISNPTIGSIPSNIQLELFPNPAKDKINITSLDGNPFTAVRLMDLTGMSIVKESYGEDGKLKTEINLPVGITTGLYFIEIEGQKGKTIKKLFVQN